MSKAGEKRGVDFEEKKFTDEQIASLEEPANKLARLEIAAERHRMALLAAEFVNRDKVLDAIPGFWLQAVMNSMALRQLSAYEDDTKALQFLTKVKASRNPEQTAAFTFEMHFDSNPYFSNSVLRKEFKYIPPSDPAVLKKDENGVSQADVDFDFERDIDVVPAKIEWKDATKNLTKLYPRVLDPEDDTLIEEPGSFFNLFESTSTKTAQELENEILELYENAIDFFHNRAEGSIGNMMEDEEEDDEEDDDSDAEEIDLEKPRKKAKN